MTYQELKDALAAINEHTDKYPVPTGEDSDQYFQAVEFNLFKETLEYLMAHTLPAFPSLSDFPTTGMVGVFYVTEDTDKVYLWDNDIGTYVEFGYDNVELTQNTTIQFRQEKDYGTISSPLNSIAFDFTDASRGVIQCVYYNAQELPPGVTWLNGSDSVFSASTTFLMILKWDGGSRVIGNLMTL